MIISYTIKNIIKILVTLNILLININNIECKGYIGIPSKQMNHNIYNKGFSHIQDSIGSSPPKAGTILTQKVESNLAFDPELVEDASTSSIDTSSSGYSSTM
ncbi:hypothetical protein SLOPH_1169 [Spraguea lophii 42_110]|uniref:Uncharacterized protein n=1 Tax=Spraguea lophii (strain 42_110) TaxID=1358809 RepID=S7WDW8_SPRLO|nr:hypothetical protein SLOPH_1169 [Spraguea lophii 42_110]